MLYLSAVVLKIKIGRTYLFGSGDLLILVLLQELINHVLKIVTRVHLFVR